MAKQYTLTNKHGKFYFKDKNKTILHREDGPAIEDLKGRYKAWFVNGVKHRIDGPAYEDADGSKVWYIDGVLILRVDGNDFIQDRMQ